MGKLNPMTLVAGVIAIAAIGLSVFMFTQVSNMKKNLEEFSGDLPAGLSGEEPAGGGEHGDGHEASTSAAIFNETMNVTYDLGEFTANTADGKYAVMDITLVIESTFYLADFEQYQGLMSVYEHDLDYYNKWNTGKIDKFSGDEVEDDHAYIPSGTIKAVHGGPTELPAPDRPAEPTRPHTAFEQELAKNDSKVRDQVINEVNSHDSKDIISPTGKAQFKQALMDGLNKVLGDQYGKIVDLYFNQLIAN